MEEENGVRVVKCPLKLEYCFLSCYWRKGNLCYFKSKHGRPIKELTGEDKPK
jgi:hypothetical protein